MVEKLNNCPNCGGTLNDAGRCTFCGSKVYDFLTIDLLEQGMPTAKTYIRVKTKDRVLLAPVLLDSMSAEYKPEELCYHGPAPNVSLYLEPETLPKITLTLAIIGDTITVDKFEEGEG